MNTGYAAGEHGVILHTNDAGNAWTSLVSGTTLRLNSICFPATDTGYAVGDSGTILKTINGGGVGIRNGSWSSKRLNIIPNPVQDNFSIDLSFLTGPSLLTIFSVDGLKLSEQEIAGSKAQISMSNLPSGIYFIMLRNDQMVETGKVIKL